MAALGCIICDAPAQVHHMRNGTMGKREDHMLVIPLCEEHHKGDFSIHNSPETFQNIYGSELQMVADTIRSVIGGIMDHG